jgi:hypothetical protein
MSWWNWVLLAVCGLPSIAVAGALAGRLGALLMFAVLVYGTVALS